VGCAVILPILFLAYIVIQIVADPHHWYEPVLAVMFLLVGLPLILQLLPRRRITITKEDCFDGHVIGKKARLLHRKDRLTFEDHLGEIRITGEISSQVITIGKGTHVRVQGGLFAKGLFGEGTIDATGPKWIGD
jgi:hypothetical protein